MALNIKKYCATNWHFIFFWVLVFVVLVSLIRHFNSAEYKNEFDFHQSLRHLEKTIPVHSRYEYSLVDMYNPGDGTTVITVKNSTGTHYELVWETQDYRNRRILVSFKEWNPDAESDMQSD